MTRLTDNDRKLGPITWGDCGSWRPLRLVWSSGGNGDCDKTNNTLTSYAFGYMARINLPNILQPYRVKHMATTWDAATVARLGRDYYYETSPREYGFSLSDGFFQLFLGPQTNDSVTTKNWCKHLLWTQWRFMRFSLYTPEGKHFYTRLESENIKGADNFKAQMEAEKACPSVIFEFYDFDKQLIEATCHIEEREWHFGEGWFKWLSLFRKPKIQRSLDMEFSSEVGPAKGSWKGGMIGTGTDILPLDTCESAFRRYCEQDHRSKYRTYKIKFVGIVK